MVPFSFGQLFFAVTAKNGSICFCTCVLEHLGQRVFFLGSISLNLTTTVKVFPHFLHS